MLHSAFCFPLSDLSFPPAVAALLQGSLFYREDGGKMFLEAAY
jgi:hypothetical protein